MPWSESPLRTLILPGTAGPNDPAIVIGPDLVAAITAFYAGHGETLINLIIMREDAATLVYLGLVISAAQPVMVIGSLSAGSVIEELRFAPTGTDLGFFQNRILNIDNGSGLQFNDTSSLVLTDGATMDAGGTSTITRYGQAARWLTGEGYAQANANLTLGTALADVPGASVTATAGGAGAVYKVRGTFDFEIQVAGAAVGVGNLDIDGAAITGTAVFGDPAGAATMRGTVTQTWEGTVGAGSHTFKLRANKSAAAGTSRTRATNTTIEVSIYE